MEELSKQYALLMTGLLVVVLTGLIISILHYNSRTNRYKNIAVFFLYASLLNVFLIFLLGEDPLIEVIIPSIITLINFVLINKKENQIVN
jgi:hypothetical protein